MKKHFLLLAIIGLTACTSVPVSPTPAADLVATAVFERVYIPLTQTALAASPTPTATLTPAPTVTPTPQPTNNAAVKLKRPVVTAFTGCWSGPGPQYTLISNIDQKKYVELLGIGSVPGWYIVRNPYFHNPCWIEAIYVKLDPQLDVSKFPVMTPGP